MKKLIAILPVLAAFFVFTSPGHALIYNAATISKGGTYPVSVPAGETVTVYHDYTCTSETGPALTNTDIFSHQLDTTQETNFNNKTVGTVTVVPAIFLDEYLNKSGQTQTLTLNCVENNNSLYDTAGASYPTL